MKDEWWEGQGKAGDGLEGGGRGVRGREEERMKKCGSRAVEEEAEWKAGRQSWYTTTLARRPGAGRPARTQRPLGGIGER